MTNKNLTEIVVVLDRSGSMMSRKYDAEGGLNHFLYEQRKLPGEARLTLTQFDTEYEIVHNGVSLAEVGPCTLEPRGGTALLDAVGRTIYEVGARLARTQESQRPGLVVFVIVTDGEENSSREYNRAQVKHMIEEQSGRYSWQFVYLGANQDAFAEAGGIGIPAYTTLNYVGEKTAQAYSSTAAIVGRMRSAAMCGESVNMAFSQEERSEAN